MSEQELRKLFTDFEKSRNTSIPEQIKNILWLMEYSRLTIGKLTETDITNLENSVPALLEDLDIPQEELPKYLGRFVKNSSKFKILPGQKSALLELTIYCKQTTFLNSTSSAKKDLKRKAMDGEESLDQKGK